MEKQMRQNFETADTSEALKITQYSQVLNSTAPFLYQALGFLAASFIMHKLTRCGQLSACHLVLTKSALTSMGGMEFDHHTPNSFRNLLLRLSPSLSSETYGKSYDAVERLDDKMLVSYNMIQGFVREKLVSSGIARAATAWLSICKKLDILPSFGRKPRRVLPGIRKCRQWVQYLDNVWLDVQEQQTAVV